MQKEKTQDVPELVSLLQKGDENAYAVLYRIFQPKIQNTARKMFLLEEDAKEVAQEVFLIIWKNRDTLKSELSFNAYLLSILKSLIIKRSKKEIQRIAYEKYALKSQTWISDETEQDLEHSEVEKIALAAIDKLPGFQKEVYILKNRENKKTGEIAEIMGISKRTVESHIYQASKSLRESLTLASLTPQK